MLKELKGFKKKFLIIIFLFFLVNFLIWKLGVFDIKQVFIEINNANCVNRESIEGELKLTGKNILFTDETSFKKIYSNFPCIKEIKLEKKFTKEVKVKIEGRVAVIKVASFKEPPALDLLYLEASPSSQTALLNWSFAPSDNKFLADSEGVVFAMSSNDSLPTVFWPEDLKVGKKLDNKIFSKVHDIILKLSNIGVSNFGALSTLKLSDDQLLANVGERIVFSLQKDINKQLASLQLILQKAKIEGKTMKSIDLRFDKTVVVF